MITLATLSSDDIGRNVIYDPEYCDKQVGQLTSWNEKYVFVRFKGPTGEACLPEDVTLEFPGLERFQ